MGKTIAMPRTDELFGKKLDGHPESKAHDPNAGKPESPNSGVREGVPAAAPLPFAQGRDKYTTMLDNETIMRVEALRNEFRCQTGKKIRVCLMIEAAVRHIFLLMDPAQALAVVKSEMERRTHE